MKDESELRKRLGQLKEAHSDAVRDGCSKRTIAIAEHKIRQLEWVLEDE